MKITVVTVCFNAEACIRNTIESVLSQDYLDIEYIIKDGMSSDKTCEIINEYLYDSRILYLSEKDSGLYDAMNKATELATGDYIIFMNAGDIFHQNNSISKALSSINTTPDIIYGDTIRVYSDNSMIESYKNVSILKLLLCGRIMCHQSMLISASLMKEYKYDTHFSITADFDFVTRAYANKKKFYYVNIIVSDVEAVTGISARDSNLITMQKEDDESLKKNLPFFYSIIFLPKTIYRLIKYH